MKCTAGALASESYPISNSSTGVDAVFGGASEPSAAKLSDTSLRNACPTPPPILRPGVRSPRSRRGRRLSSRPAGNYGALPRIVALAAMLVLAIVAAPRIDAAPLVLSFQPSLHTRSVGEAFLVDVVVEGLDPTNGSELISAFDLDIVFDPTIVGFTGVTFGTSLGTDFDQFGDASANGGVLDVFQLSFLSDLALKALQPGTSLTLFTIGFVGVAPGFSPLAFDTTLQYVAGALDFSTDPQGIAITLDVDVSAGGVTIQAVPLPGTLWLAVAGLMALALQRRPLHCA